MYTYYIHYILLRSTTEGWTHLSGYQVGVNDNGASEVWRCRIRLIDGIGPTCKNPTAPPQPLPLAQSVRCWLICNVYRKNVRRVGVPDGKTSDSCVKETEKFLIYVFQVFRLPGACFSIIFFFDLPPQNKLHKNSIFVPQSSDAARLVTCFIRRKSDAAKGF